MKRILADPIPCKKITDKNYTVYLRDNENMQEVEDNSVALVIIDPPFGIDFEGQASNYNRTEDAIKGYVEIPRDKFSTWIEIRLQEIYRILKPGGSCFWWSACVDARDLVTNQENNKNNPKSNKLTSDKLKTVLEAIEKTGFLRVRDLIWDYPFGVYSPNCFTISHQHIFYVVKPPFNKRLWNGDKLYREDSVSIRRKYNPKKETNLTETNEDLIREYIQLCSNEGDIVLDPCLGSGTTLKVCIEADRKFVGYEINPNAEKRINEKIQLAKSTLKEWLK